MSRLRTLFPLFAALLLLVPATGLAAPALQQASVEVIDFSYDPITLTVEAGTTVTWTNVGRAPHTVTADDGSFDSGRMNNGAVFSQTFSTPGSFGYFCEFHGTPGSGQFGTVVVIPSSQPTTPPPPPPGGEAPYCESGKSPEFVFGFAALKAAVGDPMGTPLECEHTNPENGDALQQTTTGLSFYRKSTNTPTFTNGFEHWALTPNGLVYWVGDSIDPPPDAPPAP